MSDLSAEDIDSLVEEAKTLPGAEDKAPFTLGWCIASVEYALSGKPIRPGSAYPLERRVQMLIDKMAPLMPETE